VTRRRGRRSPAGFKLRHYQKAGTLDQSVYEAQERTGAALAEAIERGEDERQAREALREQWAFLPAEEDEPSLPPERTSEQEVTPNPLILDSPAT
jgi:hypothetical protein